MPSPFAPRSPRLRSTLCVALGLVSALGCGGEPGPSFGFELEADLTGAAFWDFPFPADVRLDANGAPDVAGFPNPNDIAIVRALLEPLPARRGAPTMPIAWFKGGAAVPAKDVAQVMPAHPDAPALLINIDPRSPERGALAPTVAATFFPDDFVGANLVAVAPRPGVVLAPHTTYAVVLMRDFAPGFDPAPGLAALADGDVPAGARGAAVAASFAPLWPALDDLDVNRDDVIAATVFTTGDEVAALAARGDGARAAHDAFIHGLVVDPDDGAAHPRFCELTGFVDVPQFQRGEAPFDTLGDFVLDVDGVPVAQGNATIPISITIPKDTMPAAGWPLFHYFHGSGGSSKEVVDEGKTLSADSDPVVGEGPAHVVAAHGYASAGAAMPVNAERVPGAASYDYLNLNNLASFPYNFQQGVIEQRLILDALLALELAPALVAECAGVALPAGQSAHVFDPATVTAGGYSMGGMYTNMIGATDPRYGALVPMAAGGMWNLMILDTSLVEGARGLLAGILNVESETLTFAHPVMALLGSGWEVADPMTYMARLARRPLPGHPRRHVYQPIGLGDTYFPEPVYDAATLAYGNHQAGDEVWPETQGALALDGLDGFLSYPIAGNRAHPDGATTSVAVQYTDDGLIDAHYIFRQRDEVVYQYGCFLDTFNTAGTPTVPAPAPLGTPCPGR